MTYITERIIYKYIYINIIDYIHMGTGSNAHCQSPCPGCTLSWPGWGEGTSCWRGLQAVFNGTKQNVVAPLTMSVFFGGMMESGHRGGEGGECQKGDTTAELDRDQKEGGREGRKPWSWK